MRYISSRNVIVYLGPVVLLAAFFVATPMAQAFSYQRSPELIVGDQLQKIQTFDPKFPGGASVAVANVLGDSQEEYVVGAGPGGGPHVKIFGHNGKLLQSFFVLDKKMSGGLNVAAGDLDGDGLAEIAVAPQGSYAPTVEVYSKGKRTTVFQAFDATDKDGVHVAILPTSSTEPGRIVVAPTGEHPIEVRVFDRTGVKKVFSWAPYRTTPKVNVSVAAGVSGLYGEPVIVTSAGNGHDPEVKVFGLHSKKVLSSWLVYDPKIQTGIDVALAHDQVITGPLSYGGPEIKLFSLDGIRLTNYTAFEPSFRGGIRVAGVMDDGIVQGVAVPSAVDETVLRIQGKSIIVNLKKQELKLIQRGRVISIRKISSGKWSTPTPVGNFKIKNKIAVAYSREFDLYMEHWMAISPDGAYGLHALPYWKLKNGGKRYEGASHIGTPVSHGCIRQSLDDATSLFEWAPIGTPVKVVQ